MEAMSYGTKWDVDGTGYSLNTMQLEACAAVYMYDTKRNLQ